MVAEDARTRLRRAAAELFARDGYQATTVDAVAARAGVTQRTFFRHFGDKGEVLFSDDGALLGVLVGTVRGAPAGEPVLATTRAALHALADAVQPHREELRLRAAVIDGEPALRERELLKLDRWHEAVAATLRERGVPRTTAQLATGIGTACWSAAYRPWVGDRARTSLRRRIDGAFGELPGLVGLLEGAEPRR